ncbi:MAG: tetratricopeptide repeat protein [Candidatus Riflebacteria bacterium]|nr:tetratricopeptide repeat protein [Candidatus Riflebacteria bacterium]
MKRLDWILAKSRGIIASVSIFLIVLFFSAPSLLAQDAKQLNEEGVKAIGLGNFQDARDALLKAMKLDPNWAEPHYNAAKLLKLVKKYDDSKRQLKIAFELEPGNQTYRDAWIVCLKEDIQKAIEAGNLTEAKSLRAKIVELSPQDFDAALELIQDKQKAGDNEGAKKIAKGIAEKNVKSISEYSSPALGQILLILSKLELAENDYKNAKIHAEKASSFPIPDQGSAKTILSDIKAALNKETEGYLRNAKRLMAESENNQALEQIEMGLAIDPTNEELLAEKEMLTSKAEGKDLFIEAKKLAAENKWLQARDFLEAIVVADDKNTEAKALLNKSIAYEKQYQAKLGIAEPLPRNLSGLAGLADSFIRQGKKFSSGSNFKEARSAYNKAMTVIEMDSTLTKLKAEIQPDLEKMDAVDKSKETWEKGVDAYKNQEWEECIKYLELLPADYDIQMHSFLAYCYWKKGEKEKARELAHKSINRQPENNRSRFVLGNILLDEGENATAYKILKEIKDADPEYPGIDDVLARATAFAWGPVVIPVAIVLLLLFTAWVIFQNLPEYRKNEAIRRSKSYLAKQMHKECIDELNRIKRLPNITQYDGGVISRLLAQAYLKTAAYDKAIGECKHLLAITPNDPETHQWLGFAYLGRRMLSPESLPELLALYKTEKKNNALVALLGQHYISQKAHTNEGIEILERWLETEPTHPELLKVLGRFYLQKGRTDATAMKVFQSMMATMKPEPEFLLGIGKMHLKLKDVESCLKACEQVLSLDVNNEMVHTLLREAYNQKNELPVLVEIYRSFLSENPYNVAFQKGLTEANKLIERNAKAAPVQKQNVTQTDSGDVQGDISCPHCSTPNKSTDYYCQSCGKQMG